LALSQVWAARADDGGPAAEPITAALTRLRAAGAFQIVLEGHLDLDAKRLTEISGTGVFVDDTHYQVSARSVLSGAVTELKVVRLGSRQWEWSEDVPGWRALPPQPDMVTGSFGALLAALGKVRDVHPADPKECDGVACVAWAFTLPPGVATLQDMALEGTGVVYVAEKDGLPRELRVEVRTPVGATGQASARMYGFGTQVVIHPPGLGGAPTVPDHVPTPAAMEEALSTKDTLVLSLRTTGEGFRPPLPNELADGPMTLEAYIAPAARQVVATLRSGAVTVGRLIVSNGCGMEYFLPPGRRASAPGGAAPAPQWTARRWPADLGAAAPAPPAPWALHTQIVRDILRSATLQRLDAADADVYSLAIPAKGWSAGVALPFVIFGTVAEGRQITGQMRVDPRDSSPLEIRIRASGVTKDGARVWAEEVYSFAYETTPEQRAAYSAALQWAEREAPRRLALGEQLPALASAIGTAVADPSGDRGRVDEAVRAAAANPMAAGAVLLTDSGRVLTQAGDLDAKALDEFRQCPLVRALQPGRTASEWRGSTLYCASAASSPRAHRLIAIVVSKGEPAGDAPEG
jgi:hypothetical protein